MELNQETIERLLSNGLTNLPVEKGGVKDEKLL